MSKFEEMKLERISVKDRFSAKSKNIQINDSDGDAEMEAEKVKKKRSKSRRDNDSYRKAVKRALKKAAKRPILVRRKMDVD